MASDAGALGMKHLQEYGLDVEEVLALQVGHFVGPRIILAQRFFGHERHPLVNSLKAMTILRFLRPKWFKVSWGDSFMSGTRININHSAQRKCATILSK